MVLPSAGWLKTGGPFTNLTEKKSANHGAYARGHGPGVDASGARWEERHRTGEPLVVAWASPALRTCEEVHSSLRLAPTVTYLQKRYLRSGRPGLLLLPEASGWSSARRTRGRSNPMAENSLAIRARGQLAYHPQPTAICTRGRFAVPSPRI